MSAVSLVALAASGCSATGQADEDTVTLSVANFVAKDSSTSLAVQAWMDLVTEKTSGRVQFEEFYDGSLCGAADMSACVSDGRADIGMNSAGYNPTDFPIAEVGSISFLTTDMHASAAAMFKLHGESSELQAEYTRVNQKLLYYTPPGIPVIALNEEIEGLEGFRGKRIRATGGTSIAMDVLGANVIQISPAEVYESIQRGVLDGASYPIDLIADNRLYEVTPYLYDIGAHTGSITTLHWTMNADRWDSLDSELQEAIEEANAEITATQSADHITPAFEESCRQILASDAEFRPIGTPAEAAAWADDSVTIMKSNWTDGVAGVLDDPDAFFARYVELLDETFSGDGRSGAQLCESIK